MQGGPGMMASALFCALVKCHCMDRFFRCHLFSLFFCHLCYVSDTQGMHPQIILLREGTDTSQGRGQLISNINACVAVVDTVRTTLVSNAIPLVRYVIYFLSLLADTCFFADRFQFSQLRNLCAGPARDGQACARRARDHDL